MYVGMPAFASDERREREQNQGALDRTHQYVARPPERSYTAPVVKVHSSDASQATSVATSAGVPTRPIGILATSMSTVSFVICWSSSVPITAGATACTRMPRVATSLASALVSPITPALAEE